MADYTTRPAAVAGYFYPRDSSELQDWIRSALKEASDDKPAVKAMIVPHAGYQYSGAVAAKAYARLINLSHPLKRVVLIGPGHRVGFDGIAVPEVDAFTTPLGDVKLDREIIDNLVETGAVQEFDGAHCLEHSIEVQLPFLQTILTESFMIVPLLVGWCSVNSVADVLEQLWGDEETLIVISSDLSHFNEYDDARNIDSKTCRAIEEGRENVLNADHACGFIPITGLINVARTHGISGHCLQLQNSGDTSSSRDRVVGYGAFVFE